MIYSLLADLAVLLHFCFVLFVVLGGLLALRWFRYVWLHLPAAVWGALIEFQDWICPLTHLENRWRRAAGDRGYEGGFVEHYLMPVLYPDGLTRNVQIVLGLLVIAINVAIYARVFVKRKRVGEAKDDTSC